MHALYDTNPYVAAPARFAADPFTPVVSDQWRNTASVYGPAFTLVSAGVAGTAKNSPAATVWTFKVLAMVAVAVAAYLAAAAARVARPGSEVFAVAIVGLNPVMVLHVVGAGHNDAIVAALLAGALLVTARFATSRHPSTDRAEDGSAVDSISPISAGAVTVLIALAAMVKVIAVIPLVLWLAYLFRSSPRGRRVGATATQLGIAGAVTAVVTAPLLAGAETIKAIGNVAGREGSASGPRLVARALRAATGVEVGSPPEVALSAGVYLGFLAVFVALTWWLFSATGGDPVPTWGGSYADYGWFAEGCPRQESNLRHTV